MHGIGKQAKLIIDGCAPKSQSRRFEVLMMWTAPCSVAIANNGIPPLFAAV
jgi:hypothetical protein